MLLASSDVVAITSDVTGQELAMGKVDVASRIGMRKEIFCFGIAHG